jgi:hypothetical protein
MEKRILIGSIIAIAVLVLVSFTAVVGYQTTKSSTIAKASPLFSIRSKRAIDEDSKEYTCDYVGKGEESILSIPKRDSETSRIQKAIGSISKMDDETFNRLVYFLINCHGKRIKEENIPDLINVLHQLKINPDEIKNYIADEKENELYTEQGFCETVGFIWVPECWVALFLLIISNFIWLFLSLATIILDCL